MVMKFAGWVGVAAWMVVGISGALAQVVDAPVAQAAKANWEYGAFEYAVQVVPLWESFTPKFQRLNCPAGATLATQCYGPTTSGGTYRGASIEPIILRWNFTHGKRLMPWAQAAGGVVYTTRKYPGVGDLNVADPTQTGPAADTSVWNFTPQGGVGAHYFVKPGRSVDFSANGVHISSSSLGDKNPGVNVSLQVSVGYTWWR
jgi:lipid A 3-O-deacylase